MDATNNFLSATDAGHKTGLCGEPTIDELLADPLTLALMKADRVDIRSFEQMLHSAADRVEIATQPLVAFKAGAGAKSESSLPDYQRLMSIGSPADSAVAQSMHGAIAARVSGRVCGSNCTW
jgi:hypothetical protein